MPEEIREPDWDHPPHEMPSLYHKALLLLCSKCGYHEIVEDVKEGHEWRSDRTLPCDCQICDGKKTVNYVDDDDILRVIGNIHDSPA